MKRFFLFAFILSCVLSTKAQENSEIGMITINPYISETENLSPEAERLLIEKLGQTVSIGGMVGSGFDNRFVITAHVLPLKTVQTATIPSKKAVHLSITIYVGDGMNETLFASFPTEVKGIGLDESSAYINAMRQLSPWDKNLQQCMEIARQRIIDYYEKAAPNIIATGKAQAESGAYENGISLLLTIPSTCSYYDKAQQLIAQYSNQQIEMANRELLNQAHASWSASPNANGAEIAQNYLEQISHPSVNIQNEVKQLTNAIAMRLNTVEDRQWNQRIKEMEQRHSEQMARINSSNQQRMAVINAVSSIAKAYIKSRPSYRLGWW